MLNKRNNERETKKEEEVELGFLGTTMRAHTHGLCM